MRSLTLILFIAGAIGFLTFLGTLMFTAPVFTWSAQVDRLIAITSLFFCASTSTGVLTLLAEMKLGSQ